MILKDTQWISGTTSSTTVFLDLPKKMHVAFAGYSWNNQGAFLHSVFLEHYLGKLLGISLRTCSRIFWEYIMGIFHEHSTNIYLHGGKDLP